MKICEKCGSSDNRNNFKFCGTCGARFTELSKIIKTTVYLHSSKDDMYEKGEELGLEDEALKNFVYCCYEVGISIEVERETGKYKIVGVKE